jgi:hypothetical protein
MPVEKTRILYISGSPRSGSTILGRILGQISGFFQAGDLRFIWDKNIIEGFPCGCGLPFDECELWSNVMKTAFGGLDQGLAYKMLEYRERYTRTKHLPFMLSPIGKRNYNSKIKEYLVNIGRLYHTIQTITGARVIVDSSKFASYGMVLGMIPSLDVYHLHLVRDSRAVAYSRLRRKKWEDMDVYMARYGPFRSSFQWSALNLASEIVGKQYPGKYMKMNYEEFISNPIISINQILSFVDVHPTTLPFEETNKVMIQKTHSNWGNPDRQKSGIIELRIDREWQKKIKLLDKTIVTTLTFPLLARYGYLSNQRGYPGP